MESEILSVAIAYEADGSLRASIAFSDCICKAGRKGEAAGSSSASGSVKRSHFAARLIMNQTETSD